MLRKKVAEKPEEAVNIKPEPPSESKNKKRKRDRKADQKHQE
jgi:hypothetical protein